MNRLTILLTWLILGNSAFLALAQDPCAADLLHEQLKAIDPSYQARHEAMEQRIQQFINNKKYKGAGPAESITQSGGVYSIPVVVHVIYTAPNATNNISDAQVESAIQRLNDVYSNATGLSLDTGIEFCLASRDPDCNPTNGILHVDGSGVTDYSAEGIDSQVTDTDGKGAKMTDVFNLSRWNPAEYLNIYIVNEISDNDGGAGTQGYAFFPGTSLLYDGMVILYNAFGYDYDNCGCYQLKSYTNTNATAIHEIGHYLNLAHTFEGDNGGATCPDTTGTAGDFVADTPAHIRSFSCPSGSNNCYPASHPFNSWEKIIHNYMGYATETCKYEFTQGQMERMIATLETVRYTLVHAQSCQGITLSQPVTAACTPQTSTGLSANYGMGITQVIIGDLVAGSGTSFEDGGYQDHWCTTGNFQLNNTYSIAINTYGIYDEDVKVYIDYNNDGSLSETESVLNSQNKSEHTGTFTIPANAVTNTLLRLRIISDYYSYTITNSCYAPIYGQVEDYSIYIDGPNPTINATATALAGFHALTNKASTAKTFTLSGTDLNGNVTISTASNEFELSGTGNGYTGSLLFSPINHALSNKTIYVRLKSGLAVGNYSGNLIISSNGAQTVNVAVSGEVGELDTNRGNALSFEGGGDPVATALALPATYTKEAWVKYGQGIHIIGSQTAANGHDLGINNGHLSGGHNGNWALVEDEETFPTGDWVHVALTYNSATKEMKLYKNGILVDQAANVNNHGGNTIEIGSLAQAGAFIGTMDEVRIWNTARSAQEIRENMHLTLTGQETGLVAYWQFNETAGAVANEYLGGYDATLGNGATFTASSINCGREGTSQSISGIGTIGVKNFTNTNLSITFLEKNGTEDFSVTYQQFKPNSTSGALGVSIFDNPVWTINRSTATGSFTAHFSFVLPANVLSDASPGSYALYHRDSGSDGDWTLLVETAGTLSGSTLTFENISTSGQFMVVQTKESSERGNALCLDGLGAYLATPLDFDPSAGPFTIECWLKAEGGDNDFQVVFDKTLSDYSQPFLLAVWRNKIFARFGDRWLEGAIGDKFTYQEWHHVAFSWNGVNAAFYLDGKLKDKALIGDTGSNGAPLIFGAFHQDALFFQGKIEEVRIWQTARSQQEIAENMLLTATSKLANPLAYYQFNQSSGNMVDDVAASSMAAVLGSASFSPSGANVGGTGSSQTKAAVAQPGSYDFADAKLKMNLASISDTSSFTVVYQTFKPNTTDGTTFLASTVYDNPTWTLLQSNNAAFSADFTFTFPNGTFTNMIPGSYQLFFRAVGSDGEWSPLVFGASNVTSNKITFPGVGAAGQYMVVKQ
ncbi:MAG: LamG-like jellyroll fold domain-containing protein [Saprospiraceae bacterium]